MANPLIDALESRRKPIEGRSGRTLDLMPNEVPEGAKPGMPVAMTVRGYLKDSNGQLQIEVAMVETEEDDSQDEPLMVRTQDSMSPGAA